MYYENAFNIKNGDKVKIFAPLAHISPTRVSAINTVLICLAVSVDANAAIRVNQLGFPPQADKLAVVTSGAATSFEVIAADSGKTVFSNKLRAPA